MAFDNCKKKVVFSVDYTDVEAKIEEIYGHKYSIIDDEGIGSSEYNAALISVFATNKEIVYEYDKQELDKFKKGKTVKHILFLIFQDLCYKGYIEEGEYIIDVYW